MKRYLTVISAVLGLGIMMGCELDNNESARDLKFDNASRFNVKVVSLASEFDTFTLAPDQNIKLRKITLPDYTWEPKDRVDVSSQSSARNVTFINAAPKPPPTIIIITNR